MLKQWKKQIEQFQMFCSGDKVLIGCSGGADSICLTQMLYLLREEFSLKIGAVYCHHGIRGLEADEDGNYVKAFCQERNIDFYEVYEKVEERAKEQKLTVEEAGRQFRYESFQKIMKEEGYNKLAVAHNANDRAETMLFHLARGTGISGLCTMEPMREFYEGANLVRPLLWTERKDIEQWLCESGISWRTDGTNSSDVYTRNLIRHKILPVMESVNEKAIAHMGETAGKLGEAADYLKTQEDAITKECVVWKEGQKEAQVSIPLLEKQHIYMQKAVLYRALAQVSGGRKDITSIHVETLLDLMHGPSGKELSLGKGTRAKKRYEELWIGNWEEEKPISLDSLRLETKKIDYIGQEIEKNKYTKYFDCDKIRGNVVLRYWQEGDYIYLREDGGKKKVSRYFIDEKISPEMRKRIPLLADGNHIMWIVGYRISAYYKVSEDTKKLFVATVKNEG